MARKQAVSIQETVETNEDFEAYLAAHKDQLICMEVYSDFCGPCLATGNAVRKGKLEIGQDRIAMVKCCADNIDALARFKHHSEPAFLFLVNGKLTRAMFGPNGIDLCRIIEEELKIMDREAEGIIVERPRLEVHEMLPEEAAKMQENLKIEEEYRDAAERLRVLTLAARKKRVNERLSQNIKRLNFIMFWPHCHQAHYDLYEKWDMINITVAAKDTFQLDERGAREALYMSDVDPNEACVHALLAGPVLVVLFKMFETDTRDFVKLMRYTLYEEIPIPKEDVSPEKQVPPVPAYERYASISKTAREVRRDRYNAKLQKLKEEKEDAERLQAEQERLAREAQEEAARVEKQRLEEERMARIAAGLPADPEPPPPPPPPEPTEGEPAEGAEGVEGEATESGEGGEEKPETVETASEVATTITDLTPGEGGPEDAMLDEDVGEKEEEFNSDIEVEGEDYIPPGGLFVPGLYTPANELAKANGLAFFYPKQVADLAEVIETEYLPPHVLVIFPIDKRYDVQEVVNLYSSEILNMGIFVGEDPYSAEHVAYSIKQYDKMERPRRYFDRLALMVSRKRSLPLLQLAGLNPVYISSDVISGERECLAMFPVGYGDDHEEIESVEEEEVVVTEQPQETVQETVAAEERPEDEDEDEEEEPTM
ncbi:uncharacterized protein LOC110380930 isoform X1 [Helicoverpa armigera]|uniref:uncharacterized protein LOC110380930 isoform X1 n=1 Tax=Helicoverpa armigera TaxID=29058 RepID=UPI002112952A|nr:uncharacterized protein LOC110380930 isoform X1 [Helicoverpa armigera]